MSINCKAISQDIKINLKNEVLKIKETDKKIPTLAVIQVNHNTASDAYIKGKIKDCEEVGINIKVFNIDSTKGTYEDVISTVKILCADERINGVIVQLPLPYEKDIENLIINSISKEKDVDGFLNGSEYIPCTPKGIMTIFEKEHIEIEGKNAVVLGRSNIVGKPVAKLLLEKNATVTICHSKTKNLKFFTQNADILICAVGNAKMITADMIKDNAVIIDVGINRMENGKLCGDVDFENVSLYTNKITTVPCGVGLMTRISLLENTIIAYNKQREKHNEL